MLWIYIEANEILNILTSLGKMQRKNYYVTNNGGQIKNRDISGALYTLRIQYLCTQTECEDGARDVRVFLIDSCYTW